MASVYRLAVITQELLEANNKTTSGEKCRNSGANHK
jgi:hypothetical protein